MSGFDIRRARSGLGLWLAALGSLAGSSPAAGELNVGDPAPPLKVARWYRGDPVDFEQGKGQHIYVIDFFSYVCPYSKQTIPYLNQLHQRYKDRGVVFLGLSDMGPEWMEMYFEIMGDKMSYRVGEDARRETTQTYLGGVGAPGIPYTFVVEQQGRIAWHGYPDQQIEKVLELLLAGTYELDKVAERVRKAKELWKNLEQQISLARWNDALALLEQLQALSPHPVLYHALKFQCLDAKGDRVGAEAAGLEMVRFTEEPESLNDMAWDLLTEESQKGQFTPVALAAAEKANKLTEGKNWQILDTLALAKFESGAIAEAVELQRRAVELMEKDAGKDAPDVRQRLRRFIDAQKKPPEP